MLKERVRKNFKYHYDYVVVGAGSAGCVIASRLAESLSASVLLLEAGGSDNRLSIRMPSAFYMPLNDSRINWGFFSEPESGLNNRRIHCPRGAYLSSRFMRGAIQFSSSAIRAMEPEGFLIC